MHGWPSLPAGVAGDTAHMPLIFGATQDVICQIEAGLFICALLPPSERPMLDPRALLLKSGSSYRMSQDGNGRDADLSL